MSGTPSQPGTPGLLRAMNDRAALALLLEHGPLTRAQIGELTGLSKPTASQVVARLEQLDLIDVVGSLAAVRGPSAVTYGVRTHRAHAVAVDVRPHLVVSTLVDATGGEHQVAEVHLSRTASERSAVGDIRAAIEAACQAAGTSPDTVVSVAVGVQGAVDPRTDDLAFVGLMPGWPRKAVRAQLEDGLGLSVRIDNDVNLAAVAELGSGRARGVDDFVLLWVDEGLGAAIVIGGRLYGGVTGGAGEIGFLPLPGTPLVRDVRRGNAGAFQELAGGPAVLALARSLGLRATSAPAAVEAAVSTPEPGDRLLATLGQRLAVGIAALVAVLDPTLVLLSGSGALA